MIDNILTSVSRLDQVEHSTNVDWRRKGECTDVTLVEESSKLEIREKVRTWGKVGLHQGVQGQELQRQGMYRQGDQGRERRSAEQGLQVHQQELLREIKSYRQGKRRKQEAEGVGWEEKQNMPRGWSIKNTESFRLE